MDFAAEIKGLTHTEEKGGENLALIDFRLDFLLLKYLQLRSGDVALKMLCKSANELNCDVTSLSLK